MYKNLIFKSNLNSQFSLTKNKLLLLLLLKSY